MKIKFWTLLNALPLPKSWHEAVGRKLAGALWDAA